MKEDGVLILTTPNVFFFRRFFQIIFYEDVVVNPEHTCWFDEKTIKQLAERHNFYVKKTIYLEIKRKLYKILPLPLKLKSPNIIFILKKKINTKHV